MDTAYHFSVALPLQFCIKSWKKEPPGCRIMRRILYGFLPRGRNRAPQTRYTLRKPMRKPTAVSVR